MNYQSTQFGPRRSPTPGEVEAVGRALDAAAAIAGGRHVIARALGVTNAAYGNWKKRGVPIDKCLAVERLAQQRVTRRDLRPYDFELIWPDLATTVVKPGAAHAAIQCGPLPV